MISTSRSPLVEAALRGCLGACYAHSPRWDSIPVPQHHALPNLDNATGCPNNGAQPLSHSGQEARALEKRREEAAMRYGFGEFELDTQHYELRRAGIPKLP